MLTGLQEWGHQFGFAWDENTLCSGIAQEDPSIKSLFFEDLVVQKLGCSP